MANLLGLPCILSSLYSPIVFLHSLLSALFLLPIPAPLVSPVSPSRHIPRQLIILKNYINISFCSSTDLYSALPLSIGSVGRPYLDPNLISISGNPLHFTKSPASIAVEL